MGLKLVECVIVSGVCCFCCWRKWQIVDFLVLSLLLYYFEFHLNLISVIYCK